MDGKALMLSLSILLRVEKMIDDDQTLQLYGYTSDELSKGSHKPIVVVCEGCKNRRITTKRNINSRGLLTTLCVSCGQKNGKHEGKNSPTYKKIIDEFIKKHTGKHFCKCGCGEEIIILRRYYNVGIPQFKFNHNHDGIHNPMYGKQQSKESIAKNSRSNSATAQRIPLSEWKEYLKLKPYCEKFNESCRERNREKYGNKCFICGKVKEQNGNRRLSIHHISKNKMEGCDGSKWELIPLCMSCHSKSHHEPMGSRIDYLLNHMEVCSLI